MKRHLLAVLLSLALVATACGGDDDTTGGLDDSQLPPAAACEEGTVDCNDTPQPGDDDLFPGGEPQDGAAPIEGPTDSGMLVDGGLTITEALEGEPTGVIAVQGFYFDDGTGARLCEALAESFPPQCGEASIPLGDGALDVIDPDEIQESQGVAWTDHPVTILGEIVDGTLVPTEMSI